MSGAQGSDTYGVDNAGDHVIEANGGGTDNVSYVSFNLSGQELENLALRGGAIDQWHRQLDRPTSSPATVATTSSTAFCADNERQHGNDTYCVDNAGDHVIAGRSARADGCAGLVSFNLPVRNWRIRAARGPRSTAPAIPLPTSSPATLVRMSSTASSATRCPAAPAMTVSSSPRRQCLDQCRLHHRLLRGRRHHQVDNAIFAALGGNALTAEQFVKNTTGLAGDGNDHII